MRKTAYAGWLRGMIHKKFFNMSAKASISIKESLDIKLLSSLFCSEEIIIFVSNWQRVIKVETKFIRGQSTSGLSVVENVCIANGNVLLSVNPISTAFPLKFIILFKE